MPTHYPLAVLAVVAALLCSAHAPAAELGEPERRTVAMLVEFCGGLVGEDPAVVETAGTRVPGLRIGPPTRVADISDQENVRFSFREFFTIGNQDELRFAGFSDTPGRNERPYAAFKPDGENCLVVLTPGSRAAHEEIERRFAASGGRWIREDAKAEPGHLYTWRRDAPFGEKVFVTGQTDAESSIFFVSLEERSLPTPFEVRTLAHAAMAPCVAGILSARPAVTADFDGYFGEVRRRREGEISVLTLRSTVGGPRAILEVLEVAPESRCQLFLAHPRLPAALMGEFALAAVRSLPGITKVIQPARKDRPAREAWRWTKPGQRTPVDLRVDVDEKNGIVVLDISWAVR